MTEYARKTIIDYCGIDLEVFMLPDGSYTLSQSQVPTAIEEPEYNFRRFLVGNSPEALSVKGYKFGKVSTKGVGRSIKAIPIKVALIYWSYHAKKGNIKAEALVLAGTEETITRLADNAFGVVKTDSQYAAARSDNYQINQQILTMLNELMVQNQSVLSEMAEIKSELKYLKPMAEEYSKINQALVDLKELKPLLQQISAELKRNPNQKSATLANWLNTLGLAGLSNGQRKSLGRLVSDFLKVGNLEPPEKKGCNLYPESMTPLIVLASKYLV